jgi:hypothetical protein
MNDREWLERELNRPVTDDEVEKFGHKVSVLMFMDGIDELEAMELTLKTWIR